jgi:NTE family protein
LHPLKILATDVDSRMPVIFSAAGGHEQNGSVVDAVRASISYPYVFRPVMSNDRLLVDGGLCSNLPILLFAQERNVDRLPVFAFDLAERPTTPTSSSNLLSFSWSLVQAAVIARLLV